jgi:hypothetical protein
VRLLAESAAGASDEAITRLWPTDLVVFETCTVVSHLFGVHTKLKGKALLEEAVGDRMKPRQLGDRQP